VRRPVGRYQGAPLAGGDGERRCSLSLSAAGRAAVTLSVAGGLGQVAYRVRKSPNNGPAGGRPCSPRADLVKSSDNVASLRPDRPTRAARSLEEGRRSYDACRHGADAASDETQRRTAPRRVSIP